MKLAQVFKEMSWATGSPHEEYPTAAVDQTKEWFLAGDSSTIDVEGGKFQIITKHQSYGLFRARDGELLGWVVLGNPRTLFGARVLPLGNIQILPKYRNTMAILVLLNAIRVLANHPVYIDDPIFADGHALLNAIAKRGGIAGVFTIDKQTGEKTKYTPTDLHMDSDIGILLERSFIKLTHTDLYPGGSRELVLELFGEHTSDIV